MKRDNVKVTLEYLGGFSAPLAHEYRIVKIVGSPTVGIYRDQTTKPARVGDIITEAEATDLAHAADITTLPKFS